MAENIVPIVAAFIIGGFSLSGVIISILGNNQIAKRQALLEKKFQKKDFLQIILKDIIHFSGLARQQLHLQSVPSPHFDGSQLDLALQSIKGLTIASGNTEAQILTKDLFQDFNNLGSDPSTELSKKQGIIQDTMKEIIEHISEQLQAIE